jgi:tripartite-type tricarboxylate transporter receptor subunit TctC
MIPRRGAAAALMWVPLMAFGQAFPAKPVHLVTEFAAGSTGDVVVRVLAAGMKELMGQPAVVDNRPGGGGVLAGEQVARSAPDGYTLLVTTTAPQILRIFLAKSTPFDPVKDFTPVTELGESTTLLVVNPSVPAGNLQDLLEYARRNPGKLAYGTSGVGSATHLAGEQIRMLTGVELVHVPYKAVSQALQDVAAGQLPASFAIIGLALPAMRAGKVRALAVVRDTRSPALPEIPAVAEVVGGFEAPRNFVGLYAPARMPQPLLAAVHGFAVNTLATAEIRDKLAQGGFEARTNATPEDFAGQIKRQIDLVGRIVKAAGIKPSD